MAKRDRLALVERGNRSEPQTPRASPVGSSLGNRSGFDGAFADGDGFATNRGTGEPTVSGRHRECDQTRPPQFIALLEGEIMVAIGRRRETKEDTGERGGGGSGRRILKDPRSRREHPGMKCGAGR